MAPTCQNSDIKKKSDLLLSVSFMRVWISVPCQIRSRNSCGFVLDHPGLGTAAATCSLLHTLTCITLILMQAKIKVC